MSGADTGHPAASRMLGQTWHDTVAVVTGASSGLGRHFAGTLHAAGAAVVLAARRAERLQELSNQLPRTSWLVTDVTNEPDRRALVAHTEAYAEQLSRTRIVLVNNAGGGAPQPARQTSPEQFAQSVSLNLTSSFALSTAFAETMVPRGGGVIVMIASMLGLVAADPVPHAAYCAAKAGVIGLTRQLACEWARHGIRVNALAPGWFPSELTAEAMLDERWMQAVRRNTPLGRFGELPELDGPLLLLAGDQGSYLTGQTLVVDGGWTAR